MPSSRSAELSQKRYKNFTHSYATGGDTIRFYRYEYAHDDNYVVETYCHEAGHYIDKQVGASGGSFSLSYDWTTAMNDDIITSGMISPTTYGENSNSEDFAESVAEYVKDKIRFTKSFPNRTAILKRILGK